MKLQIINKNNGLYIKGHWTIAGIYDGFGDDVAAAILEGVHPYLVAKKIVNNTKPFTSRDQILTELRLINKWQQHSLETGFLEWKENTPQYVKDLEETHYERVKKFYL